MTVTCPPPRPIEFTPRKLTVENLHDDADQRWRFRHHAEERLAWKTLLCGIPHLSKILTRFHACGRDAFVVEETETGKTRLQCNTCKLRWCPACRQRRSRQTRTKLRRMLASVDGGKWQMITLTLRSSNAPLVKQIANLKQSYRRLRQRKTWRQSVTRAVGVIEATYNAERKQWHPHIHVIAQVNFLDWHKLRKDWQGVSGGSNIIDCQRIGATDRAEKYVCDYLGKPPSEAVLREPALLAAGKEALDYQRWVIRSGRWPKTEEPERVKPEVRTVGPLSTVLRLARLGDIQAGRRLAELMVRDGRPGSAADAADAVLTVHDDQLTDALCRELRLHTG